VAVVAVANDIQGAEAARPWLEKAGATYPCLLDRNNAIGKAYNVKYVPLGILLDEEGRLVRTVSSVNIDDEGFRAELIEWATSGAIPGAWVEADRQAAPRRLTPDEAEADARFQLALVLLDRGRREDAIAELRQAMALDRENWLIRKQLWAIEHPEAFYGGDVDYGWQKVQREREDGELKGKE
jgi:hypothetical protein